MKSLTTTISESLDEVSPAHAQSWSQILARAQFEPASPRKSHKRMAVLVAAVGFGLIGGTVMTASSSTGGLPSTDFDVALAPNIAAMTEPRPMSAEDIAAYRDQHSSDPIKGVIFCQSTPYGTAPIDGTIYLTNNQALEMTTDSMREVCVERSYSKARYVESFATARSLAGIEATVPNEFAVCVSEADPAAVYVYPAFNGKQDPATICQSNAMHPMSLTGEVRDSVEVRSFDEYRLWLKRNQEFAPNFGEGFSTHDAADWTHFDLILAGQLSVD